jgi:hypothetical protein
MLLSFSDLVVSTDELKPHAASLLAWLVSQYECHDPGHGKREWIQVALERLLALTNVDPLLEGSSKVEKDTDPWVLGVKAFRCSPGRHGRILGKIKAAHENSVASPSGLWAEVMANPWKDSVCCTRRCVEILRQRHSVVTSTDGSNATWSWKRCR